MKKSNLNPPGQTENGDPIRSQEPEEETSLEKEEREKNVRQAISDIEMYTDSFFSDFEKSSVNYPTLKQFIVAQFLWETNEGRSRLFKEQNNMFGLKCRTKDTLRLHSFKSFTKLKQYQAGCNKGYAVYNSYLDSIYDLLTWIKVAYLKCKWSQFVIAFNEYQNKVGASVFPGSPTSSFKMFETYQKVWDGDITYNDLTRPSSYAIYAKYSPAAQACKSRSAFQYASFLKDNRYYEDQATRYGAGLELRLNDYQQGKYR
jgi:hypothetical protein